MLHLLLLAKEGRLFEEKDDENDEDTDFATVSENSMSLKNIKILKSKYVFS